MKTARCEAAIARRLKNLGEYATEKNIEKAKIAFKDIICTCANIKKDVPAEARKFLGQLGIKEADIIKKEVVPVEPPVEIEAAE